MSQTQNSPQPQPDITSCDREPIHLLGHVQDFGCLVSVSTEWVINFASDNCEAILGLDLAKNVGALFRGLFPEQVVHDLRSLVQVLSNDGTASRLFSYPLFDNDRLFDIACHRSGSSFVFEFEHKSSRRQAASDLALVQRLIARVSAKDSIESAAQEAARALRALIGLDRVMVYKFEQDGAGTVIAEAKQPQMNSFLGLRYPASDIPKQARALYVRNPVRLIADVNGPIHKIVPEFGPDKQPLDLSFAVTRSVSPIHLEYLRNMGVAASMSVSILSQGKLWGLFACHHDTPLHVDIEKRSAAELFGQLFSYEIAQIEARNQFKELEIARELHDGLMASVSIGTDLPGALEPLLDQLNSVIAYDGIVIWSEGRFSARGITPSERDFLDLAKFLSMTPTGAVFATDCIADHVPGLLGLDPSVAGMLALPISRVPRDYVVLFRTELAKQVVWAGNPNKAVEDKEGEFRLSPRKSFEAWKEVVRGQSADWRPSEIRLAEALRVTLLEVVLKLTDEASSLRRRAEEQQNLLIAELNHRVRNIVNLIQGLVSQGRKDATSIEAYCATLDARISALARAHDQLTEREWNWVPLQALVQNEFRAFEGIADGRIDTRGAGINLSPSAFTTMALVIHELVTNSVKHGALSCDAGKIVLRMELQMDGFAKVEWAETGGPPITKPAPQPGFGMTVIEKSVPFELRGTAQTRFTSTGFQAEFLLPPWHVRPIDMTEHAKPSKTASLHPDVGIDGKALILEDNLIISMDAADLLTGIGATEVFTCSTVADALDLLDTPDLGFALIDVNLGEETSQVFAQAAFDRALPSAIATGYGSSREILATFPPFPVLTKPYGTEDLLQVLQRARQMF